MAKPPSSSALTPAPKAIAVPGVKERDVAPAYETRRIHGFMVLVSTQAISEAAKENGQPWEALVAEFVGLEAVFPRRALKLFTKVVPVFIEWDNHIKENPNALARYNAMPTAVTRRGAVPVIPGDPVARMKANSVELISLKKLAQEKASTLQQSRLVMLHEMAHVVYHLLLDAGFRNQDVEFAYNQAMERRLYDEVLTDRGGRGKAYASTNAREYFAEISCAYLDRCNFFPFTHDDLKEHDKTGYRVMERVWGKEKPSAAKKP
jgi:hypothetical protein